MDSNFDRAFDYTLNNEGGYTNNAADSGGATKYGITVTTLSRWRGKVCVAADVQTLGRDEAKAIYRKWYWDALRLDEVEKLIVATVLFDAAVLFGVRVSALRAQVVLFAIDPTSPVDGIIGPKSLALLNSTAESVFITAFQTELRYRVNEIIRAQPKNESFRDGWSNRVDRFTTLIA